jgi:hypothetical protein
MHLKCEMPKNTIEPHLVLKHILYINTPKTCLIFKEGVVKCGNIVVIFQTTILRIVGFYVRHSAYVCQKMLTKGEKKVMKLCHCMQCTIFVHCDFVDMVVFGITSYLSPLFMSTILQLTAMFLMHFLDD